MKNDMTTDYEVPVKRSIVSAVYRSTWSKINYGLVIASCQVFNQSAIGIKRVYNGHDLSG